MSFSRETAFLLHLVKWQLRVHDRDPVTADFRFNGAGWDYHDFRGDRWCNIANPDNRVYLRNAHRVLLMCARQASLSFFPRGIQTIRQGGLRSTIQLTIT